MKTNKLIESDIKSTKDYSIFKYSKIQRPIVKEKKYKELVASMRKYGFIESHAILVTKDYEVLLGQHRLEAAKETKKVVYYKVIENPMSEQEKLELMISLDRTHRPIALKDIVQGHSNFLPQYARLVQFIETSKLGYGNGLAVFTGGVGSFSKEITAGLPLFENPKRDACLEFINFSRDKFDHWASTHYIRAVVYIMNHSSIGESEVQKLRDNIMGFIKCADRKLYIKMFIKFINKYRQSKIIIE